MGNIARKFNDAEEMGITIPIRNDYIDRRLEESISAIHTHIFWVLPHDIKRTLEAAHRHYPYRINGEKITITVAHAGTAMGQGYLHVASIEENKTGFMIALRGQVFKNSFGMGFWAFTLPEQQKRATGAIRRINHLLKDFVDKMEAMDPETAGTWAASVLDLYPENVPEIEEWDFSVATGVK